MGRNIPMINEAPTSHYHLLSLSFLVCTSAVIAIMVAMCGTRFRKKHKSKNKDNRCEENVDLPPPHVILENLGSTFKQPPPAPPPPPTITTIGGGVEELSKPLPPPPSAIAVDSAPLDLKKKKLNINKSSSLQKYVSKEASRRRLSTGSINLRIPVGRSMKRKRRRVPESVHRRVMLKEEELLWTKKILKGEKCRPHEEDTDEAGVSYGVIENGKLVSASNEKEGEALAMSDTSEEEYSCSSSEEEEMLEEKESGRSSVVGLPKV